MKNLIITAVLLFSISGYGQSQFQIEQDLLKFDNERVVNGLLAAKNAFNPDHLKDGLLGMDPVSYFSVTGPLTGDSSFTSTRNGITYSFASAANKLIFDNELTNKYEPTYGGWCAWAMSQGSPIPIEVEFYSFDYSDTGEKLRIHFFVSQRALENFNNRAKSRGTNSLGLVELTIAELNGTDLNQDILISSRGFKNDANRFYYGLLINEVK